MAVAPLDPITLAVVKGGLEQVAEKMDLTLKRAAFSPTISEGHDHANGFYHPQTGEVIVQGVTGLPIFIGIMQFTTQAVIQEVERRGTQPGDVFLVNDPYSGGTHLMDVRMVQPFYYHGDLFVYMANTGHWPDMGGSVPGGFGSKTAETPQEGLRIPPVKLYDAGELNEDVLTILLANIRVAEEEYGDLKAHLAAFNVGEKRLTQLLDKYGPEAVRACMAELDRRSEQHMRACIAEIPDGTYTCTDYLDSDGVENVPLQLTVDLTVRSSDVYLDFSRSSPPCRGPMNSVIGTTKSACYIAFKHTFPDVPVHAGCFRPIHINVPHSTFLHASLPRPVAGCAAEVSQRIIDVVMGALAQAMPERMSAGIFGTVNNLTIGGIDAERGPYVMYMFNGGGYGGFKGGDGLTYGSGTISVSRDCASSGPPAGSRDTAAYRPGCRRFHGCRPDRTPKRHHRTRSGRSVCLRGDCAGVVLYRPRARVFEIADVDLDHVQPRVHLLAVVADPDVVVRTGRPGGNARPLDLALQHWILAVTDVEDAAAGDQQSPIVGDERAHGLRSQTQRLHGPDLRGGGRVAQIDDVDLRVGEGAAPDVMPAPIRT